MTLPVSRYFLPECILMLRRRRSPRCFVVVPFLSSLAAALFSLHEGDGRVVLRRRQTALRLFEVGRRGRQQLRR